MGKLIIIRGLPGSGKSTKAAEYKSLECFHFEADMYFIRPDGVYDFNASLLKNAHAWCYNNVTAWLKACGTGIVSNTFTTFREMEPYVKFCKENEYELEVITLYGEYGSIHDVPAETMKRMKGRMESHESIMKKIEEYVL